MSHYFGDAGGEWGGAKGLGHAIILKGALMDPWDKTKGTAQIIS